MTHILLRLDSRRLYALSTIDLRASVVRGGRVLKDPAFATVMDLNSELEWSIPEVALVGHLVPDNQIYPLLTASGITGLRGSTPIATGEGSIPLAGNLVTPTWLSITLSGRCDSRCKFCFTERIREAPGLSNSDVLDAMRAAREACVTAVVFTGGEPTLRQELGDLIGAARSMGYQHVGIQTNGHRLAAADYLVELRNAGLTSALVSLHGPDGATHDDVAQSSGSFVRACQALVNLSRESIDTTVNFVVSRTNGPRAAELPEIVASRHTRAKLRFSCLIIEGAAHDNVARILPTLPQFVEWVGEACVQASRYGLEVEVMNVPPCIASTLGLPGNYTLEERRSLMQASPFYRTSKPRGELDVKVSACESCLLSVDCGGIQMSYLAHTPDGAKHVHPVRLGAAT